MQVTLYRTQQDFLICSHYNNKNFNDYKGHKAQLSETALKYISLFKCNI